MFLCLSLDFQYIIRGLFINVQRVEVRGDYSFCWYWWNSLFGLSFQKCLPKNKDTKWVTRSCYPKKDIQHNCQKKRHKNTNNEPIYLFHENIDRKSFLASTQYIIQFYGTLMLISHGTKGSNSKNWLTQTRVQIICPIWTDMST